MTRFRVLAWLLLLLLSTVARPAVAQGQPAAATGSCQWVYSAGGIAQFADLYNDPDATSLNSLRFGDPFVETGFVARDGYLDFDGNGVQDVFRVVLRPDGLFQWQYSPNSTAAWENLAYADTPVQDLRFGDFDGDNKTDVFTALPQADGTWQWSYAAGGLANFVPLKTVSAAEAATYGVPRLGDFDGDGLIDLFVTEPRPDGAWQWKYVPSGTGVFINLFYAFVSPADLRFGDFNRDSRTDVFAALSQADGSQQWSYSAGGLANFLLLKTVSAAEAATYGIPHLGDFDGDGYSDLFVTEPRPDGAWQWKYAPRGSGAFVVGANAVIRPVDLRFGQFNGSADGYKTDVFAAPDCSQYELRLPLIGR